MRVPVTDRGELVAHLVPAHEPTTTFAEAHDLPTAAPGLIQLTTTPAQSSTAAAPNAAG